MKVRAIRLHEYGGADKLRYEQADLPEPGEGEARVRHTAIGLNFIDIYHRTGLYPAELPVGLGTEAAGVVEAVGKDVSEVRIGDRVVWTGLPPGTYAR
jgi:NADPH2:quinone reductase